MLSNQNKVLKKIAIKLQTGKVTKKILVGFDGFIDEIIHVVDEKKTFTEFSRINRIIDFANRIASASGLSSNIELVPQQVKLGGNGPIMANALIAQGYLTHYIGALGTKKIIPIFQEFAKKCESVITLTEPGHTDALEFFDGKIMFGKMNNLTEVNYENILKLLPRKKLLSLMKSIDFVAFTNWTSLSEMNSIIIGFDSLFAEIENRPLCFFDLADPKKRSQEDIKEVIFLIKKMQSNADIILGLNKNESKQIAEILGKQTDDLIERATFIRNIMDISSVVIHPLEGAVAATKNKTEWFDGPYTKKPKLTTGAGDNFNAGFCNGWLSGLSLKECLASGVSTSGFYVRNSYSPNRQELIAFMNQWSNGKLND